MTALTSNLKLSLLALAAIGLANVAQAEDVVLEQPNGEKWTIAINPGPTAPAPEKNYAQVYNSIPFSRAAFDDNPSYRHDATMEILTGQLRPGTQRIEVKVDSDVSTGRFPPMPGFTNLSYPYSAYFVSPYGVFQPTYR